ncbi:TauD/TfdA family dioxygenase [Salinispora arenicola]|uniref:TauD/TfdA family dioxygenase n=1 Tax=Salinispora arenicola TaxID=168697 RepID=UPI000377EBD5|nr:TauD/TfdA family dioxygenase [Salinispora arenicola]
MSLLSPSGLHLCIAPDRPPVLGAPPLGDLASAEDWLAERRDAIRGELLRHGHLMIRGLPVATPADFAAVRDILLAERAAYKEKATPRSSFGDDVFSSTDLPPAQPIKLHNENSYTLDFPGVLLFGCLKAPAEGGATTVADVREVLATVPADLAGRFDEVGWLLNRSYHTTAGLPWTTSFGTDDRAVVERYCADNLVGCHWVGEADLRTSQRRSAIVTHPVTGDRVWFNHAAFWSRWSLDVEIQEVLVDTYGDDALPFDTAFGDGEPLGEEQVRSLNEAYDGAIRRESWQPGDLMLVDNILSAHGRDAFRGGRSILVAMGEPVSLHDCAPTVEPAAGPGVKGSIA